MGIPTIERLQIYSCHDVSPISFQALNFAGDKHQCVLGCIKKKPASVPYRIYTVRKWAITFFARRIIRPTYTLSSVYRDTLDL